MSGPRDCRGGLTSLPIFACLGVQRAMIGSDLAITQIACPALCRRWAPALYPSSRHGELSEPERKIRLS